MTKAMTSADDLMNRSNCFKLFAACFHEPDKSLFREERVHENLTHLLGALTVSATESVERLNAFFVDTRQDILSVDHAALFIGPFGLIAPPYGSVYLEKNYQVQGESTVAAEKYYLSNNLVLDVKEPADHIAVELEFMSHLSAGEAEAVHRGDRDEALRLHGVQGEFLLTFMAWIPQFCERIRKGAQTEYYRSLADCLQVFFTHCCREYSP